MKLPALVKNWVSIAGATIALIALFMIAFLFAITILLGKHAAYLGLVVFILLPGIMIAGLLLIPLGMYLKHRRGRPEPGWPHVDLNNVHQRNAALIFVGGTVLFLFLSAFGSYQAYEYTDSVSFCGTLCHRVMKPEYTAHEDSPHARVACVACHVGPGAGWYVRSKLSGLYQVYAVATDSYPRPIPTPIEHLRPARQVCEQCHWPQKFYGEQYLVRTHFLQDGNNTRWDIGLALKIGPPEQGSGYISGIHWHVNPHVRIEYVAADPQRSRIPWVRSINRDTGEMKTFMDPDNPIKPAALEAALPRTMDCLDCHNRPSHPFRTPNDFLDEAMAGGEVPTDLPDLKAAAVVLCSKTYPSSEAAMDAIRKGLTSLYRDKHPGTWAQRRGEVEKAIAGVQAAFARNIFPGMKARWSAYPNHIGHLESTGCFRCHNGRHRTSSGETIPNRCDLCHAIMKQGTPGAFQYTTVNGTLEFQHPVDIGGAWKEMACSECHESAP